MSSQLGLPANAAVFLVAAAVVWFAGTRAARYADVIERRTGVGEAWLGMLLLGGISGLPELAVTLTAAIDGHPVLAVNNIVGSAAANLAILGAADAAVKRETLTLSIATPTPLLQASLVTVMLGVIAAGTLAGGEAAVLGIGAWSWAILALYLFALAWIRHTRSAEGWTLQGNEGNERPARAEPGQPVGRLPLKTLLAALAILAGGFALARSGEALAQQTGLGQTFFGAVFLSFATSLSDISIVLSAVRLGRYEMAIGDVFGSALFTLALVFAVDAAYQGPPALAEVGPGTTFLAILGMGLTALFIAGAVERRGARIGRMGIDSLALLAAYFAGLWVLYGLQ